ncbi:MAG: ATP-binding protein [candidate division Zixibacteria bacterium]
MILLFLIALLYASDFFAQSDSQTASDGVNGLLAIIIITTICLCVGVNYVLANHFIKKPIRSLANGMNKLADKKFSFRLDEDSIEQYGSLTSSFNDMAELLSSYLTELEKSRDYLRGILESSADIIITVNPSGKIRTINMGVTNVLGYRRRDVIGKSIDVLLANPNDRQIAAERLRHSDNVVNYETQFLTKDGKYRDILFTLSQLRNSYGAIIGTIAFCKDITHEKRLQEQLMQSQRFAAIGQVFTGIQHSMKNMLNACQGGAYMVRIGLAKDNKKMLEEGWEMVQEGITRLTDMSRDMLKYVKEWKPRFESTDLKKILSDILNVIRQTAKDKGIEIKLDFPERLPSVICDSRMIHSCVMDIVSNAIDACTWKNYTENELPEINVSAYLNNNDEDLIIEVQDNGCGMTPDVKESIFNPFFSTKSKAGTGLGLSITSKMINVHGGKINVDTKPNKGTIFRIVLPLDTTVRNKEINDGQKSISS